MALGTRRAEAAKAYLVSQGVEPIRIEIATRGEGQLVVEGPGEIANAENRRGQFRLLIADPYLAAPKKDSQGTVDLSEPAMAALRAQATAQKEEQQVAEKVGRKRSTVANQLRLLDLPSQAQEAIRRGLLSMGHARALLGLSDAELRQLEGEGVV